MTCIYYIVWFYSDMRKWSKLRLLRMCSGEDNCWVVCQLQSHVSSNLRSTWGFYSGTSILLCSFTVCYYMLSYISILLYIMILLNYYITTIYYYMLLCITIIYFCRIYYMNYYIQLHDVIYYYITLYCYIML